MNLIAYKRLLFFNNC